ncbi:hypothetical protein AcW2_000730 [Taiwanofungus camphoratus]|nr:hypothetical protein AcW2_000730 [Antrodia cinnamomea]
MFSQFRQAVESLAQHSPKSSQDLSTDDRQSRPSLDLGLRTSLSSSQLAESALSNFKKTLVTQRSGSPGHGRIAASSSSESLVKQPAHRSTLEDRLRAKLAASDATNSTTPSTSSKASTSSRIVTDHPLSPTSTPLPESPASQSDGMKDLLAQTGTSVAESLVVQSNDIIEPLSPAPVPETSASQTDDLRDPLSLAYTPLHNPLASSPRPATPAPVKLEPPSPETSSPAASSESIVAENTTADQQQDALPPTPNPAEDASASRITESDGDTASSMDDPSTGEIKQCHGDDVNVDREGSLESNHSTEVKATLERGDELSSVELAEANETSYRDKDRSFVNDEPAEAKQEEANEKTGLTNIVPDDAAAPSPTEEHVPTQSTEPAKPLVSEAKADETDIEGLQMRLKLVEQRFADVSTSFKRLQAEKLAADKVLQEFTPVGSVQEVDALRDYMQNMNLKTEMTQDEIKRLTGKLTRQEERIEELRDIHRLESKSQSDQIETLRGQVNEAEALLKASQGSTTRLEEESVKRQTEIERLEYEIDRIKGVAKDEEEKRVKAVALLKTVRQKLVKAEKERDEISKEFQSFKSRENEQREKDSAEKLELQNEIQKVNSERETTVSGMRAQFDKELTALKDRQEKETAALRAQFELEAITTKSSYAQEVDVKNSRIAALENSIRALSREKDEIFDQLQLRQAELESSQSHSELLQGQNMEYQYQLREASDRITLLTEELEDARQDMENRTQGPASPSAKEVTRILLAAEAKYESRISELRRRLSAAERERDEGEVDWNRKLSAKVKEVEDLRRILDQSDRSREEDTQNANVSRREIETLKKEVQAHQQRISELLVHADKVAAIENAAKMQTAELNTKVAELQRLLEEDKNREAQLRVHNKTLREELRKVQSSAALLARQRGPGVGYWASRQESTSDVRSPRSSVSDLTSRENPSRPSSPAAVQSDEDINVEYLRNVILQFLEHKEMRPHLVRILSTILRFTPQETRRLVSKV